MIPPLWLFPHTVTVKPYLGTNAYGDEYGPESAPVRCWRDEEQRIVVLPNGEQGTAAVTLTLPGSDADALFPLQSKVGGLRVIMVAAHDDGDLGAWQTTTVGLA